MSHTDNLLQAYHAATDAQKRRGRAWYDAARDACAEISATTGVDLERVAAVLAITSPDAQLLTNLKWTLSACEAGHGHGRYPRDQRPKVYRALHDHADRVSHAVSGPKVSAFHRAILGDNEVLVIDRWAAFAAGEARDKVPGARLRVELEDAYRAAAADCGESVRDFQAIVWIVAREGTPRVNGGTVRRWDFS